MVTPRPCSPLVRSAMFGAQQFQYHHVPIAKQARAGVELRNPLLLQLLLGILQLLMLLCILLLLMLLLLLGIIVGLNMGGEGRVCVCVGQSRARGVGRMVETE